MSDVLFGQAYYLRFDPKLWEAMQPYPPLGTLYAAGTLRARGFDVALFDAMLAASEREWVDALERHRPRFAILYEDNFNYLSKMCLLRMRAAAYQMIHAAKARGATVIVCGADATDHARAYAAEGADYVLLGEGEGTLVELMERLDGRSSAPLESILGLAFPANGLVQLNARRPVLKSLDALPLPAWDLIDAERYRHIWRARHGRYSVNMVTTRGCPYHCNWCAKPIWGQRYNVRSPENVVDEMRLLRATIAPDHLWFADDIFGLEPGWIARFAELVEREHVRLPFKCLSRADLLLRTGEVDALRRAGAEIVWIGAESGSQKILDAMDKGIRVEQIAEAAERLHRAGMKIGFFLQFGYPGESMADIELTLDLLERAGPDEIGISVSYPMPGTKFFDAVKAQLGEKQNWVDSDDLDMMYEGPFTTDFYRKLHGLVHKELHVRQARAELRSALKEPRSLDKRHLRRAAGLAYRSLMLPFDRRRLKALALAPHRGIAALSGRLTPEEAARPTAQQSTR